MRLNFVMEFSFPDSKTVEIRSNKQNTAHAVAPARQACVSLLLRGLTEGAALAPLACKWLGIAGGAARGTENGGR